MLRKCKEVIKEGREGYVICQVQTYVQQNGTIPIADSTENEVDAKEENEKNEDICETIVSFDHVLVTMSGTIYYTVADQKLLHFWASIFRKM